MRTDRLILRALEESDLPDIQRNFEDWSTVRYLTATIPWPYPQNGSKHWYTTIVMPNQGVSHWSWAICLKESPKQLIGVIELFREATPSNRGFWLDSAFRGHGYMEEAANVVNEYAFTSLNFHKLLFDNALGNTASRRIKEKTGATCTGIGPAKFVDPTITKMEHWELTKEDWEAHKSRAR